MLEELIKEIQNHLDVCAPHIKEREQCQLLIKALNALKSRSIISAVDLKILEIDLKSYKTLATDRGSLIRYIEKQNNKLKQILLLTEKDLFNLQNSKSTELPDGQTCHALLKHRMDESKLF